MALTLSKTGIAQNQTINAWHVTQSIDAFAGTAAYNITLSGSLSLTGSVSSYNGFTGSLLGTASFANTATAVPQVTGYFAASGSLVAAAGILKFIAGASKTAATHPYHAVVTISPADLTGKTLNQTLFVATTPATGSANVGAILSNNTSITFESNVASTDFTFIATYI